MTGKGNNNFSIHAIASDSSAIGCWFRINFLFNGAVNDVTPRTAVLAGDPVRIVQ